MRLNHMVIAMTSMNGGGNTPGPARVATDEFTSASAWQKC